MKNGKGFLAIVRSDKDGDNSIFIGDTEVKIGKIQGGRVKLLIQGPATVIRKELLEAERERILKLRTASAAHDHKA